MSPRKRHNKSRPGLGAAVIVKVRWFVSKEIFSLGNDCICHCITIEAALFGLNADIDEISGICRILDVAVAVGGDTHHASLGNGKYIIVHLERAFAGENDVVFLVGLMAVEERYCLTRCERAKGNFA